MKYVVKVTVNNEERCTRQYDTHEQAQAMQNRILVERKKRGQEHVVGVPAIYRVDPSAGMPMPDGEPLDIPDED